MATMKFIVGLAVFIALMAVVYGKSVQTEDGVEVNEKDIAEQAYIDYVVNTVDSTGELPPEARGWWSNFRDRYVRPAIPAVIGGLIRG